MLTLLLVPLVLMGLAYLQKDQVLRVALREMNQGLQGKVAIADARISPFENFPYISIDLQKVEVHESKLLDSDTVIFIEDAYIGFDLLALLRGNLEVRKIKLENGFVRLVQASDGSLNITKVLSSGQPAEASDGGSMSFALSAIELTNIDVLKFNEEAANLAEAFVETAKSSFTSSQDEIVATLSSRLLFNLIIDSDTSFLHDKHISLKTAIHYNTKDNVLNLSPSELLIERAQFLMEGRIDLKNDLDLDLTFSGQKPNFDLFLAFIPEELDPLISRYDNGGKVYFDASIKGPAINGKVPHIEIDFGCADAFVENTVVDKGINDLYFKGHLTPCRAISLIKT